MLDEEDGVVLFEGEHSIEVGKGPRLLGNWQGFAGNAEGRQVLAVTGRGQRTGGSVRLPSPQGGVKAGGGVCGGEPRL